MVKTRAKGRRTLNKAKSFYEEQGWLVDEVELGGKFRSSRDLFSTDSFGGFDLIGLLNNRVKLIQVKTNRPPTLDEYKRFAKQYAGDNVEVESYTWYDSRGPVIHKFLSNGTVKKTDLRK